MTESTKRECYACNKKISETEAVQIIFEDHTKSTISNRRIWSCITTDCSGYCINKIKEIKKPLKQKIEDIFQNKLEEK